MVVLRCVQWVLAAAGLCVLVACGDSASGGNDGGNGAIGAAATPAAASGGTAGAPGNGGSASGVGGASGTAGSAGSAGAGGGHAGTAGAAGSAGAQSGSGGSAGSTMPPRDAGPDASGDDSGPPDAGPSAAQPLAERVCPKGTSFGNPLPSANPMAQPIMSGFVFLEGPVWIADKGWLLFSDMNMNMGGPSGPPSRIRRLKPPSTFDVFAETSNSNGLAFDLDGQVLACTHDMQTLSRFNLETGAREPLALTYMGKHFNSPNDLTVRSDGTVYFSDPDWQSADRPNETMMTGVYRVTPDDKVELVDGSLNKPNGITLSLDEKTLYVGSVGSEIWKYPVNADGSVGSKTVFARPGGSDGLGIDCAGNLYVTGGNTVKVYAPNHDPNGQPLGTIMVSSTTSNVAFGGADRKTLFITAGNTLHSIALNVPGLPY